MNRPFIWDRYSDQPYPIEDKKYKKYMRKKHIWDFIPLIATNIIIFPLSILLMKLFKGKSKSNNNFYGIGVNLDKGNIQQSLIEELGVKSLLIRVPLNDIYNIDRYVEFIKSFGDDKEIVINIIQDREHIKKHNLLAQDITIIFDKLSPITKEFQIASTINRTKWGFFSIKEFLEFFKVVQDIRDDKFKDIILIAPSVIDFEYHYTIRAMFNLFDIKYDRVSSLLYVDRRGSPYNTQMVIFDTKNKIDMLYSIVRLSPKIKNDNIYITEVNWPIKDTAPYAPTSEKECVDEEIYANYMIEYFDIAKKSRKISKVFWHQLVASGYGLVDIRDNRVRKREAFYKFKEMIRDENKNRR
ncbi:FIG00388565: hypothetical protein [hydrothermal vent metagenome]|uniref:Uncharacterized protein n=1 Tax=hydrothermal vent metagenome TaxID=652676 RepID=A0A1W1EKZ1_9ZZZZ